ncbi:hypothetical protein ACFSW8_15075 [Rubritalea tangerina]|uniref:Uncharacterized protein n=1 Tax=Rubritalea tangerina TaxID=430798 RepID=A0ABW4ZE70_9BACT
MSADTKAVRLVGPGSLNINIGAADPLLEEHYVYAKKVETGDSGAYAWWVGDEGVKVRINHELQEAPESHGDRFVKGASSAGPGIEMMDDDIAVPELGGIDAVMRERAIDFGTVRLTGPESSSVNYHKFFFDASTEVVGIRTSTNGGLQRDLSIAMSRATETVVPGEVQVQSALLPEEFLVNGKARVLYPIFETTGQYNKGKLPEYDGPTWMDIWAYGHQYLSPEMGGMVRWVDGVPTMTLGDTEREVITKWNWYKYFPQVSKWASIFSHDRQTHTVQGQKPYVVRILTNQTVEMFNPYNLDFKPHGEAEVYAVLGGYPFKLRYSAAGVSDFGNASVTNFLKIAGVNAVQFSNIDFGKGSGTTEVIPAGKAIVYSAPFETGGATHHTKNTPSAAGAVNFKARKLERGGGGGPTGGTFAYVRSNPSNQNTGSEGGAPAESLFVDANESVRVELFIEPDTVVGGASTHAADFSMGNGYRIGRHFLSTLGAGTPKNNGKVGATYTVGGTGSKGRKISDTGETVLVRDSIPMAGSQRAPLCIVSFEMKTEGGYAYDEASTPSASRPFKSYLFCPRIAPNYKSFEDPNDEVDSKVSHLLNPYHFNWMAAPDPNWSFWADSNLKPVDFDETNYEGYMGSGTRFTTDGTHTAPLREIPLAAISSMAQLQHAGLGDTMSLADQANSKKGQAGTYYGGARSMPWQVSYPYVASASGNSWAHPLIGADSMLEQIGLFQSDDNGALYQRKFYDKCWLINTALWDDYFYSSVGIQRSELYGSERLAHDVLKEAMTEVEPLPNTLYQFDLRGQTADGLASELLDLEGERKGYREIAEFIRSVGDFNVNSTSKRAWKGFLASLSDEELLYFDGLELKERKVQMPVSRFSLPMSEGAASGDMVDETYWDERWRGARQLGADELDALAEEMVKQVRARGPFLSVADFLNRRLEESDEGVKGALQAAIDATDINESFELHSIGEADVEDLEGGSNLEVKHKEALIGASGEGAPGYVTQADLLMPLAPYVKVRSDTFRIRTYGESRDTSGKVVATAWCEAIVQRTVDFVDGGNEPEEAFVDMDGVSLDNLSALNERYGRKIKIVSFRWLNADEV